MSYIKPVFVEAGGLFVDGYSRGGLQTYLIRYPSDILSLKIDNDNCCQYKVKKEAKLTENARTNSERTTKGPILCQL